MRREAGGVSRAGPRVDKMADSPSPGETSEEDRGQNTEDGNHLMPPATHRHFPFHSYLTIRHAIAPLDGGGTLLPAATGPGCPVVVR